MLSIIHCKRYIKVQDKASLILQSSKIVSYYREIQFSIIQLIFIFTCLVILFYIYFVNK